MWDELWDELTKIFMSLQSAGEAVLTVEDLNAHIGIQNLNLIPTSTKKPTNDKLNSTKLLWLCATQRLSIPNWHQGCEESYTRMTREQKTAVDFVLVNDLMLLHIDGNFMKIFGPDDFSWQ